MSQVFKLALPGVRVQDAGPNDLVIDSDHPNPKIYVGADPPHSGNIFLNWQDTTGVAGGAIITLYSFPHKFDYVPLVIANYNFNNGVLNSNGMLPFQLGALGIVYIEADGQNINLNYISVDLGLPATAIPAFLMTVKFYVFVESGQ